MRKMSRNIEQQLSLSTAPLLIAVALFSLYFWVSKSWSNEHLPLALVFIAVLFSNQAYFMLKTQSYAVRGYSSTREKNPRAYAFILVMALLSALLSFALALAVHMR